MAERAVIKRPIEFDAGHRVPDHGSKCRNLHGHRYRVELEVAGPILPPGSGEASGMVLDFGDLKSFLTDVHDMFDHRMILYREDPLVAELGAADWPGCVLVSWIPTAENFARAIYYMAVAWFRRLYRHAESEIEVVAVTVYETPNCSARYPG